MGTVQTDDGVRDRLLRVGWLEDGVQRSPSLVALFSLGSQDAETGCFGTRAPPAGQAAEVPGLAGERLQQSHDPAALSVDTQARAGDASGSGAVHAVPQPSRGPGHGMLRGPVSAGIQRRLEDAWASATPRTSATIDGGTGADRGLPERSFHRLDTEAAADLGEAGGLGRCRPQRASCVKVASRICRPVFPGALSCGPGHPCVGSTTLESSCSISCSRHNPRHT